MTWTKLPIVAIALITLPVTLAQGQVCVPGPECQAADTRAQSDMARWASVLSSPSTHQSSEAAYCSNAAVVDVARICEQEFRSQGNEACAQVAAAQAVASQEAADSAWVSANSSAATANWSPVCGR